MNNITADFGALYHPFKAFVIYKQDGLDKKVYVEGYDMDSAGHPINAHPLSVRESTAMAKALRSAEDMKQGFLKPDGLLPKNVLYINAEDNGFALWYTPKQKASLLFSEGLGIANGKAEVPALLWKATKESLCIYALKNDAELNEQTPLYHAPFFNIYQDGKVCMGTVSISISLDCRLETFMQQWESYFFNSYFSHLLEKHVPVKGNIVQLWKSLIGSRKKFPVRSLIKNNRTIKHLIQ